MGGAAFVLCCLSRRHVFASLLPGTRYLHSSMWTAMIEHFVCNAMQLLHSIVATSATLDQPGLPSTRSILAVLAEFPELLGPGRKEPHTRVAEVEGEARAAAAATTLAARRALSSYSSSSSSSSSLQLRRSGGGGSGSGSRNDGVAVRDPCDAGAALKALQRLFHDLGQTNDKVRGAGPCVGMVGACVGCGLGHGQGTWYVRAGFRRRSGCVMASAANTNPLRAARHPTCCGLARRRVRPGAAPSLLRYSPTSSTPPAAPSGLPRRRRRTSRRRRAGLTTWTSWPRRRWAQ